VLTKAEPGERLITEDELPDGDDACGLPAHRNDLPGDEALSRLGAYPRCVVAEGDFQGPVTRLELGESRARLVEFGASRTGTSPLDSVSLFSRKRFFRRVP